MGEIDPLALPYQIDTTIYFFTIKKRVEVVAKTVENI